MSVMRRDCVGTWSVCCGCMRSESEGEGLMARHCWAVEVPKMGGGWRPRDMYDTRDDARFWLPEHRVKYPEARIVKYTPEDEDE